MSFLHRVAGLSLRDRVRSSVIRERFKVEPLLLHIKRSQLRWFRQLVRMLPGRLPGEMFQVCPTGRGPQDRLRTGWRDYRSQLAWELLCLLPEELVEAAGGREVWASENKPQVKMIHEGSCLIWAKFEILFGNHGQREI